MHIQYMLLQFNVSLPVVNISIVSKQTQTETVSGNHFNYSSRWKV